MSAMSKRLTKKVPVAVSITFMSPMKQKLLTLRLHCFIFFCTAEHIRAGQTGAQQHDSFVKPVTLYRLKIRIFCGAPTVSPQLS